MEGKMKTAVMLGIGKMGFEERDIPHIYPMAIEAVSQEKVNLKGIVTDIFDLDDV